MFHRKEKTNINLGVKYSKPISIEYLLREENEAHNLVFGPWELNETLEKRAPEVSPIMEISAQIHAHHTRRRKGNALAGDSLFQSRGRGVTCTVCNVLHG